MSVSAPSSTEAGSRDGSPRPPRWVSEFSAPPFVLVEAHEQLAADLSAEALTDLAADLYDRLREESASVGAPHPLRFWNFIPRILDPMEEEINRYMVFNAGRHRALRDWFAGPSPFESSLPTATGVGYSGDTLHVYCLASKNKGIPTENPRQRPAYRYSNRFGPLPPCFARATLIDWNETATLLIGGTASVRGEASMHVGNLEGQLEETFENLTSLLDDAIRSCGKRGAPWKIEELRTYFVRAEDETLIRTAVDERFPGQRPMEMVQAQLCRPELLVEIEGIASIPRP